jgi:cytochrome c2
MLRAPKKPYDDVHVGKPDVNAPVMFAWKDHALEYNETERENPTRMFIPKEPDPYRPHRLEKGLDSFVAFGCYGCHKLDATAYPWMVNLRPKVGPPLDEIATKAPKSWAFKWVRDPKDFRPDTRMPRFWGLANNAQRWEHIFADGNRREVDGAAWNATEIYAIVEWIYDESTPRARKYPPVDLSNADPKRGEAIVVADYHQTNAAAKACIACHDIEIGNPDLQYDAAKMADWTDPRDGKKRGWKQRMSRRQGPALRGLASKVTPEWLYAWLKDPRGYWNHTNMPNLRLTDQEAKDVVAYLMTLRNEDFEKLPPVAADQKHILLMARELKVGEQKESTSRAIAMVEEWTPRQRTLYVGKKLFKHYGCFGCHQIEAYKNETPIGTELTEWGSKFIERLEFNHAPIDHTRFDFAYTKMRNPRIYDLGMPRASRPYERLRMPRFGFTPDEARELSTLLIALVDQPIPPKGRFNPDDAQRDIMRGRRIVRRYNCQGCHLIENEGGDVFPVIEQEKWRPPNLIGQGIKTQPDWLFHFLKDPLYVEIPGKEGTDRIRPWHSIRMPTFHLSDEESRSLVRYFAALAGGPIDFETRLPDSLTTEGGYAEAKTLQYPAPDGSGKTIRARATNAVQEARALLDAAQCLKCHAQTASLENAAPSFRHVRSGRLRSRWLQPWLWGPGRMMPGTSMPGFFIKEDDGREVPDVQLPQFFGASPDRQIEALADYIRNHYSIEEDR